MVFLHDVGKHVDDDVAVFLERADRFDGEKLLALDRRFVCDGINRLDSNIAAQGPLYGQPGHAAVLMGVHNDDGNTFHLAFPFRCSGGERNLCAGLFAMGTDGFHLEFRRTQIQARNGKYQGGVMGKPGPPGRPQVDVVIKVGPAQKT